MSVSDVTFYIKDFSYFYQSIEKCSHLDIIKQKGIRILLFTYICLCQSNAFCFISEEKVVAENKIQHSILTLP
jgi:hypothetical protein